MRLLFLSLILIFNFFSVKAENLKNCEWSEKGSVPCINITKTNNTSKISEAGVNKTIITKQEIQESGYTNMADIFKNVSGLSVFQSGNTGQSASIFMRGSESNHTLVMLNGIPINDMSVTDGMHDFGQDFAQGIQQIEIYKGSNGAQFGSSAIAGAINFITSTNYINDFSVNGFNGRNNSFDVNYTKITDNDWQLSINGAVNQSNLGSATADGTEDDGTLNRQLRLIAEKWINDNIKIKSNFYSRETRSYYDDMDNNGELGYVMDNTMQSFQASIDRKYKNSEDNTILHWHAYAKEIDDGGVTDSNDSQSIVAKYEKKFNKSEKYSFGFGSEYKYDWAKFINRGSFNSFSKGDLKNFGVYANVGLKILDNSTLSVYARNDDHHIAGKNNSYKIAYNQSLDNFDFGTSHSTGLRNPTLYELYGSNNYGYKGNINAKAEKSKTNEIYAAYSFSNNLMLKSTVYRAKIYDRLEFNDAFTSVENKKIDLNQEGIESEFVIKNENEKITLFANFLKSKNAETGKSQQRRPDITYGANYKKNNIRGMIGLFDFNLNYKFTGKHSDYDGGTVKVKSTNMVDIQASKNILGIKWNLTLSNLLNERYERPATYSADGRQIRVGFKKSY
jgi:vitamin B12 transporter